MGVGGYLGRKPADNATERGKKDYEITRYGQDFGYGGVELTPKRRRRIRKYTMPGWEVNKRARGKQEDYWGSRSRTATQLKPMETRAGGGERSKWGREKQDSGNRGKYFEPGSGNTHTRRIEAYKRILQPEKWKEAGEEWPIHRGRAWGKRWGGDASESTERARSKRTVKAR